MSVNALIKTKITGIKPIDELPIDEHVWHEAHGRHTRHERLHAGAFHRAGIAFGMEVFIHPKNPRKLLVAPGLGIDSEGRVVIIPSMGSAISLSERGVWYVVATYSEVLDASTTCEINGKKTEFRIVEQCQVKAEKSLPSEPYLELARVELTGTDKAIVMPADPFDPGLNELNLLYRQTVLPQCIADGTVSEIAYNPKAEKVDWKPNRPGLVSLVKEGNLQSQHLRFGGPARIKELAGSDTLIVYLAGDTAFDALNAEQVEGLRDFLATGGVLLAESMTDGGAEFIKCVTSLVGTLGGKLTDADLSHPVFTALHVFGSIPRGALEKGKLQMCEELGIFVSTMNYGTAWRGRAGAKGQVIDRERSREALEFGLNILAHAATRKRTVSLLEMINSQVSEKS